MSLHHDTVGLKINLKVTTDILQNTVGQIPG